MTPDWKIAALRSLARKQLTPPRRIFQHEDRDQIKRLAEADFLGLFEAHGFRPGRRGILYCPFHKDDTPSAHIYKEAVFCCFGCGLRLDVFGFVMKAQHVDFRTALDYLSRRYGVPLQGHKMTSMERLAYARQRAVSESEARAMVDWRDHNLTTLRRHRNRYLQSYHRALRLILRWSLAHPLADLWADVADKYESNYQKMDRRIERMARAQWSDLIPQFRARREA